MESNLWDTALMITQLCTSKCSERLQRAMDLFSNGDAKGAQAILNEEEIEKDIQHNINLIKLGEKGKKGLKTNIEEYKLKVSILSTEMPEGWLKEQCELYDRIIELSEIAYGKESLETAQALTDEALPLYLLDEYKTFLEYSLKALNIRKTILGDNHLDTAQSYNDAGIAYGKLGDNDKYLEYAQKGMEIRERLGADDVLLAESYNTVGCAWGNVGNNEKNLEYNLKSLDLRRKAFGENHLETANAYSNVGVAYAALEQFDKYLEYSLKSYEITKNIVGDKHPDMARCYNNLADANMCLNDYQKAIIYLQKALDVQHTTVGKYSDSLIIGYENLSVAYEQSDELEKAIDNEMNAIKVSEKVWGRIHPESQKRYRRAGELLDHYGDYNLALRYLYEALDIHLELSKEPSFEIADLCHEIGSIHFFMQDYDNAEKMISNSVNILSDLDEQYACYPDWLLHFGQVYEKEEKYKDALEQFELCLSIMQKQNAPEIDICKIKKKIKSIKDLIGK